MKYNQNKKIMQVTETTLVIGVDIAKHKHYARALNYRGIELGKGIEFENNSSGFARLGFWICEIRKKHQLGHVIVGMEPTGHYWLNLEQHLRRHRIKQVLVNPAHVKKSKELDDNSPTKNDPKDAYTIARLVVDGRYSEPHILENEYAELRLAMNHRERLVKDQNAVKARIINWLDRYFPEFTKVFKGWEGKAALSTLENFSTPAEIADKTIEEIVTTWRLSASRSVGRKKAQELVEAAKESVGLDSSLSMARSMLLSLLRQYRMLEHELNELECVVEGLLKQIPGTSYMLAIKGLGVITVAGILAETGNLLDYRHYRQIQRLAGLNLKESSSGKHKGKTTIAKRGRPRLRALLFRAIMPLVSKNPEFKALHNHFTSRETNPLKKMQSIVALCCRLLRVLFAISKQQVPYDPNKVLKCIQRKQEALVA